jgi:hypothetical protein
MKTIVKQVVPQILKNCRKSLHDKEIKILYRGVSEAECRRLRPLLSGPMREHRPVARRADRRRPHEPIDREIDYRDVARGHFNKPCAVREE